MKIKKERKQKINNDFDLNSPLSNGQIKNAHRGLKPVRDVIKKGLAFCSIVGLAFFGTEIIREVKEESTTENKIVNIGPVVLRNKETRTAQELYTDIENAIINTPGIEKIFYYENLTNEEKEELLQAILESINKEANLNTNNFESVNFFPNGTNGAYFGLNLGDISITTGNIFLKDINVKEGALYDNATFIVHEMLHAVDWENLLVSDQLTSFEKKLYNEKDYLSNDIYYSSFIETNVQLLTSKIMLDLQQKYYPDMPFNTFDNTELVFDEIIKDLYNVNYKNSGINFNTGMLKEEIQDQNYELYTSDSNIYKSKTLSELLMLGYKEKLDELGIDYSNINLEETHYYKTAIYALGDKADVRFADFETGTYNTVIENVQASVVNFENNLDKMDSYKIGKVLSGYVSAMLYNGEDYTEEERNLMTSTIYKHLDKVEEKHIIRFGLQELKEQAEKNQNVNLPLSHSNTTKTKRDIIKEKVLNSMDKGKLEL